MLTSVSSIVAVFSSSNNSKRLCFVLKWMAAIFIKWRMRIYNFLALTGCLVKISCFTSSAYWSGSSVFAFCSDKPLLNFFLSNYNTDFIWRLHLANNIFLATVLRFRKLLHYPPCKLKSSQHIGYSWIRFRFGLGDQLLTAGNFRSTPLKPYKLKLHLQCLYVGVNTL